MLLSSKLTPEPIPDDLLHVIASRLATTQLATFARLSHRTYAIATPLLYGSTSIDLDQSINQLFAKPPPTRKRSLISATMAKVGLSRKKLVVHDKDKKGWGRGIFAKAGRNIGSRGGSTGDGQSGANFPPSLKLTRPHRFSFVIHLTITAHLHDTCESLPPLVMPRLQTLQILPGLHQIHLDFCTSRHLYKDEVQYSHSPVGICPLISQLRPRRLLIGADTTGLTGLGFGLNITDAPLSSCLREIEVFAGCNTGIEHGPPMNYTWLDKLPSTLTSLSLILQPREAMESYDSDESFSLIRHTREGLWSEVDGKWRFRQVMNFEDPYHGAELLWNQLAMGLSGNAGTLEVVGMENIIREWAPQSDELRREEVRKALKVKLLEKGWREEDAEARAKAVHFTEREDFQVGLDGLGGVDRA